MASPGGFIFSFSKNTHDVITVLMPHCWTHDSIDSSDRV
jgi:hypothetical protein